MFVDSHCHLDQLDLSPYDGKLENLLAFAKENGVTDFLCVCIDMNNFPAVLEIAKQYDNVSASVGVHPNEKDSHDPSVDELVKLAGDPKIVAIGETGLDYYRSEAELTWQQDRFRRHIQAAKQVNKPLIIHSRQAREDTLAIMREENASQVGGVMHCFTDTWEMAEQAMELGFYISFSGIVTFRNAHELQQVAINTPLEKMLIETDSPYLAPDPFRGKSNQPAYVRYVAEKIAELKGVEVSTVAKHTTENYRRLFQSSS